MKDKAPTVKGVTALRRPRRLVAIVWLFVGIVVALLGLVVYSVNLLSSGRAFAAAEGHWTRAQKDAVFHLRRYALEHDETDLAAFRRAIQVPLAVRRARVELAKPRPDLDVARAAFIEGNNHPDDVDGMLRLYFQLRQFTPMRQAIELWKKSDPLIDELAAIGDRLQADGAADANEIRQSLTQIDSIHDRIAAEENNFSLSLGDALRTAKTLLLSGMLLVSGALLLIAIGVSRRFLEQSERLQRSLRESEAQLRNLIESAPLPLLIARVRDEQILYANERALQQFALTEAQARGRLIADFYADRADRDRLMEALDRMGSIRDQEIEMQDRVGRRFWLLVSAQRIRYGGEACLLAALNNIDDRKRMQDDMRHKAMHDGLTNLPNRAMFMEALDRALRKASRRKVRFSVLFIDLDRFKVINDTLGHHAGDQLLLAVAERLRAAVRSSDLVARLGGDEFVVLIEEHGGPEEVMIVAQKVLQMLDRPVLIDWREVAITCSIGVASYPEDGESVEALVKNADIAMYQAKERGRNNFQFYSSDLNKLTVQRLELETRLRGALQREEFFLVYQPEVDIATGRVVGFEALVRWNDPASGTTMPSEFIPLAEETGTILAIGRWVIDRALRDLRSWREQGLDLYVSCNVSARQLQHHDLVNEVFQSLQAHDVPPRYLHLEVTESVMMTDTQLAERALRGLKALGVEICVDDFGTGYSSLSLVRRFPFQAVKIDRSFVAGCPGDRECSAIVKALAAMGQALGVRVVAEGVESEEQRLTIQAYGCGGSQGNFFSRPVEAAKVPSLAQERLGLPDTTERSTSPAYGE